MFLQSLLKQSFNCRFSNKINLAKSEVLATLKSPDVGLKV